MQPILGSSFAVDNEKFGHCTSAHKTCENISHEYKHFINEIDGLVHASASATGDELAHINQQIKDRVNAAKCTLDENKASIVNRFKKTAAFTENYVHEQPWRAVTAGVVAGTLLGALFFHTKKQP